MAKSTGLTDMIGSKGVVSLCLLLAVTKVHCLPSN